jgi:hypothetical protein
MAAVHELGGGPPGRSSLGADYSIIRDDFSIFEVFYYRHQPRENDPVERHDLSLRSDRSYLKHLQTQRPQVESLEHKKTLSRSS